MKRALAFLKATLLGGVIVVLPAWLAVLLVLKALGHLEIFVKPVSSNLPRTLEHPRVIAHAKRKLDFGPAKYDFAKLSARNRNVITG